MNAQCPRCFNHTALGTDYASFFQEAERGELKLFCGYCGVPWQPSPDDQAAWAERLRKHLAEM
jgi:hypothetical protein